MSKEGTVRLVVEQRGKAVLVRPRDDQARRWIQLNARTWGVIVMGISKVDAVMARAALRAGLERVWGWAYDFDVVLRVFATYSRPCPGCIRFDSRHPTPFRGTSAEAHAGRKCGPIVVEHVEEL